MQPEQATGGRRRQTMGTGRFVLLFVFLVGIILYMTFGFMERPPEVPLQVIAIGEEEGREPGEETAPGTMSAEERREIDRLLASLGEAAAKNDFAAVNELLDLELLGAAAFHKADLRTTAWPHIKRRIATGNRRIALRLLPHFAKHVKTEVRRAVFLSDPHHAALYCRHWAAEGTTVRMRYYVTRRHGSWRLYDFEELGTGVLLSDGIALGFLAADSEDTRLRDALRKLQKAQLSIAFGLADDADKELAAAPEEVPDLMRKLILLTRVGINVARDDYARGLDLAERCDRLDSPPVVARYFAGVCLNGLGRHRQALESLRVYARRLGADDVSSYQAGVALSGMKKPAAATRAFTQGLRDNPRSAENLLGLVLVLPSDRKGDAFRHLGTFDNPEKTLQRLAVEVARAGDARAVLALKKEWRRRFPQTPPPPARAPFGTRRPAERAAGTSRSRVPVQPFRDPEPMGLFGHVLRKQATLIEREDPRDRDATFHVVARGDTLSGIARRYGTSVHALQRLNRIGDPNQIRVGMRLRLPSR